jgi:hypothetical protein
MKLYETNQQSRISIMKNENNHYLIDNKNIDE